mmetsp:Transcript_15992/g.62476  ORF Transcript_15992/g.62476 Transcript_15992/m.62476 type:complete len:222 (+) Transcript_15992:38-703(+)
MVAWRIFKNEDITGIGIVCGPSNGTNWHGIPPAVSSWLSCTPTAYGTIGSPLPCDCSTRSGGCRCPTSFARLSHSLLEIIALENRQRALISLSRNALRRATFAASMAPCEKPASTMRCSTSPLSDRTCSISFSRKSTTRLVLNEFVRSSVFSSNSASSWPDMAAIARRIMSKGHHWRDAPCRAKGASATRKRTRCCAAWAAAAHRAISWSPIGAKSSLLAP